MAKVIYNVKATFPQDEKFGLVSQMRRAAVSVSANIAEGTSRQSRTEQARFVEMSYGSLMELVSEAKVAENQGFLQTSDYIQLRAEVAEISRMLSGLRRSLLRRKVEGLWFMVERLVFFSQLSTIDSQLFSTR